MRDLIDREAVMEIILMPQNVSIIEQLEMLKKLPSAQQWTPVTEGLPIEFLDRRMLVSTVSPTGRKSVDVGLWEGGKWTTYFPIGDDRVTAWMPLPEPHKGGDAE